ncbi:MAG: LamG-like jellyroll fold domain-containing protein [Candidatus Eisenbacteria bacterium]
MPAAQPAGRWLCRLPLVALCLLTISPSPAAAQSPGLVAAYAFDEGFGTTVGDASGHLLSGAIEGAIWTATGKYGSALSFSGTSSYVDLGNPALLQLTGSMTWSAWIYAAANPFDDGVILAKSDNSSGWQFKTSPDTGVQTFGVAVSPSGAGHTQRYSTTVRALNTWYYVAAVYDAESQTLDIYVDGVLDNSTLVGTIPASQTDGNVNAAIGRRSGGNFNYFNGVIDEVRIYSRALTQAEIQADMNTPLTPPGLTIAPTVAALTFTRTQQFTANSPSVVWLVDGVVGGTAAAGTITSAGLYTPPIQVGTHTVTVQSSDLSGSVNATVHISNLPGVFTHHYDNLRTGLNPNETVLTPASVAAGTFGKIVSYPLDGLPFSSPVYAANVEIPSQGSHNVVYVATEHNSVYAYDADGLSTAPLWHVTFLGPGVTTVPCADTGECGDIPNEIGITGTPVIDPATGTLYVVAKTKEGPDTYVMRLHALDIATGAEKLGGPVTIQASVPGTGIGSSGGVLDFLPLRQLQRPALLLENGIIYVAFASHGDWQPYHGWVIAYDATTLQQTFAHCVTPDAEGAGIWQSGGGLATDAEGNIYFATGDGTFTADVGGRDYGDSVVKLSPSGAVLDYFTPYDQLVLDQQNIDLCAGGVLLLPDQPGPRPHLLIAAGKNATVYLIDRDNMGHFHPGDDSHAVQTLPDTLPDGTPKPYNFINPVYFNGSVYFSPVGLGIQQYQMSDGLLATSPTSVSPQTFRFPGGPITISANGVADAILWAVQRNGGSSPGALYAYDPANLGTMYYNSNQAGARDVMEISTKYSMPTVANGKVYVVSVSKLTVYGGISSGAPAAPAAPVLATPANGAMDAATNPTVSWIGSSGASSYQLQIATDPGFASVVVNQADLTATSCEVAGLAASTLHYWRVNASNAGGTSGYSTIRSFTTVGASLGLRAAYGFDEGVGTTTADRSGSNNTGTLAGAIWTTQGRYGGALEFDGTTSMVTVPDSPSLRLTSGMTLEAWVYPATAAPKWTDILMKGSDNYYLEGSSLPSGLPAMGSSFTTPLYGAAVLPANTWSHLAATYDGDSMRIWVNGSVVSSRVQTGTMPTSSGPLSIGGDALFGQHFAGRIDEVRIYDRARSLAELQADMTLPIVTSVEPGVSSPPRVSAIVSATPNPFSRSKRIRLRLESTGATTVRVFDVAGRLVRAFDLGRLPHGERELVWTGTDNSGKPVAAGVYIVRMEGADGPRSRRIVLVR